VSSGITVRLDDLRRRFGRVVALDGVSFTISPGEVLGLLGPNGAGKTTTMRVLTGYLRPDSGRVVVGDVDAGTDPVGARALLGYAPESAAVPPDPTVRSYLRFCATLHQVPRRRRDAAVDRALHGAGLTSVAGRVIGELSKGYRRRVTLAQAMVHGPPVLVLDEPTEGLDPAQVAETRTLIARLGREHTVLLSSHLLAEVDQLCRRVVVINRGRVVADGAVAELTTAGDMTRVELKVTGDSVRAARWLEGVPGVLVAEARGDRIVVRGRGAELATKVSEAVVAGGFGLLELRTASESLEDAYLRLLRE
jgi:ABC-2 type transport system ATP-binding protein